jgi:restriction system protein
MAKTAFDDPIRKIQQRHPERLWKDGANCYLTIEDGEYVLNEPGLSVVRTPDVLLWFAMVTQVKPVEDGIRIGKPTIPWFEIRRQLSQDPEFRFWFADYPRRFEEFIAGMYQMDGCDEVVLTPRSGDHGRDVIATRYGSHNVRVLDSVKARSRGKLVSHSDVRDMFGVISLDPSASKGAITTTSDFAPRVATDPKLSPYVPYRLELRNGIQVLDWLKRLPPN